MSLASMKVRIEQAREYIWRGELCNSLMNGSSRGKWIMMKCFADSTSPSGEVNIPGTIMVGENSDRSSARDTSSSQSSPRDTTSSQSKELAGSQSEQDRMSTR